MEWPRIEIFAGLSATAGRKRADVIRGGERERADLWFYEGGI